MSADLYDHNGSGKWETFVSTDELAALIPGPYYMDPPDGGSVSVMEQLRRMAHDAEKWRNGIDAAQTEAYAEGRKDQREDDMRLLNWAYSKLQHVEWTKQEDALAMDEIKLIQMGAS